MTMFISAMLTFGVAFIVRGISSTVSDFNLYYLLADVSNGLTLGLVPVAMIGVYWLVRLINDWRKLKHIWACIQAQQ
jgi:hypothetical protein